MWGSLIINYQSLTITPLAVLMEQHLGKYLDMVKGEPGQLDLLSFCLVPDTCVGSCWNTSESY